MAAGSSKVSFSFGKSPDSLRERQFSTILLVIWCTALASGGIFTGGRYKPLKDSPAPPKAGSLILYASWQRKSFSVLPVVSVSKKISFGPVVIWAILAYFWYNHFRNIIFIKHTCFSAEKLLCSRRRTAQGFLKTIFLPFISARPRKP